MVKGNISIGQILYHFVQESGYIQSFVEDQTPQSQFKVSNISKFFNTVKQYEKDNPESNVYEYVDFLNYSVEVGDSPLVDQEDMEEFDAVNILTVHSAKGLEFPVVFLINLVSDRFPSRSRKDQIPIPDQLIKETLPTESDTDENIQEEETLLCRFY